MGRASTHKRLRREHDAREAAAEQASVGRYVPYESLLSTGRSVRYHNREGVWWIEVQMAGDQGSDRGPDANRSFLCALADERSARRTGGSLLSNLRRMHQERKINTDVRYNMIIQAWAEAVKAKIVETNAHILEQAEERARDAHQPNWMDLILRKKREQNGDGDDTKE